MLALVISSVVGRLRACPLPLPCREMGLEWHEVEELQISGDLGALLIETISTP